MSWNSTLNDLWSFTSSDPKELETKIRSCLRGHSTEAFLRDITEHIAQGQHATARQHLNDFLTTHPSAGSIRRRFELVLLFRKHHSPQALSIKSKQLSKEQLIKDVNELVACSRLQAAETLLLEAIETTEDPDYLNLLGRVYMLQRRPIDAAETLQKGLMLQRQRQAFIDTDPEGSDLPTQGDLAFLDSTSGNWEGFDAPAPHEIKQLNATVNDSLSYIQHTATQYPSLEPDNWWDKTSNISSEPPVSRVNTKPGEAAATSDDGQDYEEKVAFDDQATPPATARPILKLNRRRSSAAPTEESPVRVSKRTQRSLSVTPATEQVKSDPAEYAPKQTNSSAAPAVLPVSASSHQIVEEQKYQQSTATVPSIATQPKLTAPTAKKTEYLEDNEPDDEDDIYEQEDSPGFHYDDEHVAQAYLGDFRELDDEYAAYAFDPDDIFEDGSGDDVDSDEILPNKITREERALQKAAELVGQVGWPLSTLPLIQQIFIMSGWGATRLALEREIEKGVTPDELILAAHIKAIWAENDIYWIAFDRTGSSQLSHQALSWPAALLIVRSFDSLPQVDEIEFFLEEIFASWYENLSLRRTFKAFARYLWFRFANLDGCLPANQRFDFSSLEDFPLEEYSDLGRYDLLEMERTERLRDYGVFQTKHPQEPACYFSDLPPKREEEYEAKAALIAQMEKKQAAQKAKLLKKSKAEADVGCVAEDNTDDSKWSPKLAESALKPQNYQHAPPSTVPSD